MGVRVRDSLLVDVQQYAAVLGLTTNQFVVAAIEHAIQCKQFGRKPSPDSGALDVFVGAC